MNLQGKQRQEFGWVSSSLGGEGRVSASCSVGFCCNPTPPEQGGSAELLGTHFLHSPYQHLSWGQREQHSCQPGHREVLMIQDTPFTGTLTLSSHTTNCGAEGRW